MEPKSWKQGVSTDSPTIMASSARQMVATGLEPGDDPEDDCISVGDVAKAFLKGEAYGPDERVRYVKYKAYKGAPWRVFRLRKSLYGSADAPHRFYSCLMKWMVAQGFVQASNDKCVYVHPVTRLRVGTHVDDLLVRGKAKHQRSSGSQWMPSLDSKAGDM